MIRFVIDPTLVREALLEGRQLVVTVRSATEYRVTLGDKSPHRERPALAKKRAA